MLLLLPTAPLAAPTAAVRPQVAAALLLLLQDQAVGTQTGSGGCLLLQAAEGSRSLLQLLLLDVAMAAGGSPSLRHL
jgi:hypothetical protein